MQSGGYMYNQVWSTTPVFRYNLWCDPQQLRVPWALHLPLQIFIKWRSTCGSLGYTVNSLWNLNLQPVSPPCNPPQGSVIFQGSFFFLYWSVVLPIEEPLDSWGPWIWLLEVILWNGCLQSWRFGSWFLLVCFSSKPIFVKWYENLSSQNLHPLEWNEIHHLWVCWTEEAVVSSRLLEEESPIATSEYTGRSLLQSKCSNSPWPIFSDEFASVFVWMQFAVIQNPRLHLHGALSRSWGGNSPLWNNWCVKNWVGAVFLKQGAPWSRPLFV